MTSYSLSLHEIDTVRNSKGIITSAIEIMVRKSHIKILSDPLVKTLITTKWQRFAGAQFCFQMLAYLVFVVAQTFLVWLHCSSSQWNQTSRQVGVHGVWEMWPVQVIMIASCNICPFKLHLWHFPLLGTSHVNALKSPPGPGDCLHDLRRPLPAAGAL